MNIQNPVVALMIIASIILFTVFAANYERFQPPIMVDQFDVRPAGSTTGSASATPGVGGSFSDFGTIEADDDPLLMASDEILLSEDGLLSDDNASGSAESASPTQTASATQP